MTAFDTPTDSAAALVAARQTLAEAHRRALGTDDPKAAAAVTAAERRYREAEVAHERARAASSRTVKALLDQAGADRQARNERRAELAAGRRRQARDRALAKPMTSAEQLSYVGTGVDPRTRGMEDPGDAPA